MNEVLEQINEVRQDCGLAPATELKKGTMGMSCDCPIANTIYDESVMANVEVGDKEIIVDLESGEMKFYDTSAAVEAFVKGFDEGLYPEYEEVA